MTQPRLTIAFDVAEPVRARAMWAFEHLVAHTDLRWKPVAPGHFPDIGYGCSGTELSLPLDAAAWDVSRTPPAVTWEAHADIPEGDILAFTFWHLARVEELAAAEVADVTAFDEHDRFRAAAAHEIHGIDSTHTLPPVDALADRLQERLEATAVAWPGGHPAAIGLTHDIDLPLRYTQQGVRRIARTARAGLRRANLAQATSGAAALVSVPYWRLRKRDPFLNARAICELERLHGARSTCYIITGQHAPEDGAANELLAAGGSYARDVLAGGGALGLHGSYTTSVTPGRLADERVELEKRSGVRIVDHRFHYLRHQPPRDWPMLAAAGCMSDASLGWAEHPGFRSATSRPYRAWDHTLDRPLDVIIVPLAFMDATLEPRYLDVQPASSEANDLIDNLVDTLAAARGAVSVLWHNDKLRAPGAGDYTRLYERLLRRGESSGIWLADVGSIASDWRSRLEDARE